MVGANQQQATGEASARHEGAKKVWSDGALRHVFENSPDAILIIQDGLFVDCNNAAVEMFRSKSKEDLLTQSHAQLSPWLQPDGEASTTKLREMIGKAVEHGLENIAGVNVALELSDFALVFSRIHQRVEIRAVRH